MADGLLRQWKRHGPAKRLEEPARTRRGEKLTEKAIKRIAAKAAARDDPTDLGQSNSGQGKTRNWRPLVVAGAVLAVYLAALGHWYQTGHSVRDLVFVGHLYLDGHNTRAGPESPAIANGPVKATTPYGFDGQFYYFIALDPGRAAAYIDDPSYRFQRIAYPIAARAIVVF